MAAYPIAQGAAKRLKLVPRRSAAGAVYRVPEHLVTTTFEVDPESHSRPTTILKEKSP